MKPPPIETQRRRRDFLEGVAVELPDGQAWHLRLPSLTVRPAVAEGRVAAVQLGREGLEDYDRLSSILYGETRVTPEEFWAARFAAGCALMTANYHLGDDELTRLLETTPSDPSAEPRWRTIEDTFLGLIPDPKAAAVASNSPA